MKFTDTEREALTRRVARAVSWTRLSVSDQGYCMEVARTIVKDIDEWGTSSSTAKRTIVKIAERMERTG